MQEIFQSDIELQDTSLNCEQCAFLEKHGVNMPCELHKYSALLKVKKIDFEAIKWGQNESINN